MQRTIRAIELLSEAKLERQAAPIVRFGFELCLNFIAVWCESDEDKKTAYRKAWLASRDVITTGDAWIARGFGHPGKRATNLVAGKHDGDAPYQDIRNTTFRFVDPFDLSVFEKAALGGIIDIGAFMEDYKLFTAASHAHYIAIWPKWGFPDPLHSCTEAGIAMLTVASRFVGFPFDKAGFRMALAGGLTDSTIAGA